MILLVSGEPGGNGKVPNHRSASTLTQQLLGAIMKPSDLIGKQFSRLCRSSGAKYCGKHIARLLRTGGLGISRRENGTGNINAGGYVDGRQDGRRVYEHIFIAEKALGKKLPPKACVHHVNGKRDDNKNTNLVICPSSAYHHLLHKRMKMLGITRADFDV